MMKYYRTAALLSWLIVGGAISALLVSRGAWLMIPFYLIFVIAGGTVPALICAWALKVFARASKRNGVLLWMLRGAWLGWFYITASYFIMRVIGNVSLGSIKGFLCLIFFGPSVLMQSGHYGLLVVVFIGLVNGAVLYMLWSKKD